MPEIRGSSKMHFPRPLSASHSRGPDQDDGMDAEPFDLHECELQHTMHPTGHQQQAPPDPVQDSRGTYNWLSEGSASAAGPLTENVSM